jgi:hypothetical protein
MSQRRRRRTAAQAFAGYVYPFDPSARAGRIDQGQDFGGTGSIRAIGNAVVTKLGAPGWPGGKGILYKLLDGPQRGRYIYVYEGVEPSVRVGQRVKAGQTIGKLIRGSSTGIEIGWADAQGVPLSHGGYTEGKETHAGKSMADFLHYLQTHNSRFPWGPAEQKRVERLAEHEGLKSGIGDVIPGPSDILSELFGGFHPEAFMLNVALIGGGAFLAYYGVAMLFGIKRPVATPLKAVAP